LIYIKTVRPHLQLIGGTSIMATREVPPRGGSGMCPSQRRNQV
jgi:hypothetical protein